MISSIRYFKLPYPKLAQYLSQETECQDTDAKGVQVIVDALLELVSDQVDQVLKT